MIRSIPGLGTRPTSVIIIYVFLLFATHALAQLKSNFSGYPLDSQPCLYQAANSSPCSGATNSELNACLCTNGGNFLTNTAACIGKNDPGDLRGVYSTLSLYCSQSNTPVSISESQFLSMATSTSTMTPSATKSASGTPVTATVTPGAEPTGTGSPGVGSNTGRHQLSTGAVAGIAVAGCLGGVALIGIALFFYMRRRRRRARREESHPMLPTATALPFGGNSLDGSNLNAFQTQEWQTLTDGGTHTNWQPSPSPGTASWEGQSSWGSPPLEKYSAYGVPGRWQYAPYPGYYPEQQPVELAAPEPASGPVEMYTYTPATQALSPSSSSNHPHPPSNSGSHQWPS